MDVKRVTEIKDELLGHLELAVSQSDQILFTPEGEKALLALLDMQEMIETAVDQAKAKIEDSATKIDPNFTAVVGRNIKVGYQFYGSRFDTIPGLEEHVPKELVEKKVSYKLNPLLVERWEKENGSMPEGVFIRDRKKSITFRRKETQDGETV